MMVSGFACVGLLFSMWWVYGEAVVGTSPHSARWASTGPLYIYGFVGFRFGFGLVGLG